MNSRTSRPATRSQAALIHRGPQATNANLQGVPTHAPNAALLIDFDNVTMGIRSDLGKELRSLLSSEIIKGKVAVQRAYADWRRYPQYIVPLAESSIDLIFAPAYGSSKKNATDIRLAIDALELVFTRPEIGTFILLSGDSDFSSMVMKLKEYGKYVIGVGIRESSSDLLVQNCDEYYSYNALAGLVKASDEEPARKWDPWELVREAVNRMKSNGDVMRSDRLKQVMQDLDASFDEKNLQMAKFSRFVQEAANRGLLSVTKLDNGQLEIDLPRPVAGGEPHAVVADASAWAASAPGVVDGVAGPATDSRPPRRSRRGGRGRGRDREDREGRVGAPASSTPAALAEGLAAPLAEPSAPLPPLAAVSAPSQASRASESSPMAASAPNDAKSPSVPAVGQFGDLLTRSEAFDLVKRAVESLAQGDAAVRASVVRTRARELLGRDSQSLSDRMFIRVLKDAHDAGRIDLRRRGDDFEVARAADAEPVADQVARAERLATPTPAAAGSAGGPRVGMGPRGAGSRGRGRPGELPAELLSIGVVSSPALTIATPSAEMPSPVETEEAPVKKGRAPAATRKPTAKKSATAPREEAPAAAAPVPKAKRAPAKKSAARPKKAGVAVT